MDKKKPPIAGGFLLQMDLSSLLGGGVGGCGAVVDLAGGVVATGSVVPASGSCPVVCATSVLLVAALWVSVVAM